MQAAGKPHGRGMLLVGHQCRIEKGRKEGMPSSSSSSACSSPSLKKTQLFVRYVRKSELCMYGVYASEFLHLEGAMMRRVFS